MTIKQLLEQINIPFAYGFFKQPITPPYIVYVGGGQDNFGADNTWYATQNRYQIEYYFAYKNEANEQAIEQTLLAYGFNYTKSEDVFIESEGLFVIYYQI